MKEFLVNINPIDGSKAEKIVKRLQEKGTLPQCARVYVGIDSSIAITRPPTARVEQVFDGGTEGVTTARIS